MILEITHTTQYAYGTPAAEAYGEARMTPLDREGQRVLSHSLSLDPETRTSAYTDFFGNTVHSFSLPYRHKKLVVTNRAVVETSRHDLPAGLQLTVGEARQIFSSSALPDIFPYLQATDCVPLGQEAVAWGRRYLRGDTPLGEGLEQLNQALHDTFEYRKGTTTNSTTLREVWRAQKGVCQDFAHLGLSILRTAGLPARYVCGYIESGTGANGGGTRGGRGLTGALATHAWIEVLVPGMEWAAMDPTNRKWVDDQYVAVSFGRDFSDATPLRGTFKGSGGQKMIVKVYVRRRNGKK